MNPLVFVAIGVAVVGVVILTSTIVWALATHEREEARPQVPGDN